MLICDKRRPRTRGDTNIRPPQGGRIKTAPPASGPRLWRSLAWGGTPPAPWAAPLARLRAPGPCCLGHPVGGVPGTGAPGGEGGQRAALSTLDAQPLAVFGLLEKFKRWAVRMHGGGFGGRAPRCRAAVGNPAQAVGGQGAAAGCARRPRTGRGCPRATGFRAHATHRVRREWPQTRMKSGGSVTELAGELTEVAVLVTKILDFLSVTKTITVH